MNPTTIIYWALFAAAALFLIWLAVYVLVLVYAGTIILFCKCCEGIDWIVKFFSRWQPK